MDQDSKTITEKYVSEVFHPSSQTRHCPKCGNTMKLDVLSRAGDGKGVEVYECHICGHVLGKDGKELPEFNFNTEARFVGRGSGQHVKRDLAPRRTKGYFGPWPIEDPNDEAFVKWAKKYGLEPGSDGSGAAKDAFRAGCEYTMSICNR